MSETSLVNPTAPAIVSTSTRKEAGTADAAAVPAEPKKPSFPLIGFVHADGVIFESIISRTGYMQFACLKNGTVEKVSEVETADRFILPQFGLKGLWECNAFSLPSDVWVHTIPTQVLLEDIKSFIARYADAPAEWMEPIALYVMMTWVFDRFTAVPYLRFLGEPQTGKTRLMQAAAALCFRSLCVSGNITGAALYRSLELTKGTLAVDEADFKQSEAWSDITKVFNCGYMQGFAVIRNERVGNEYQPTGFSPFGPKIISTRHRFDDQATESRCITFETKKRALPKHIPLQLPLQFYQEAGLMQNKLLRWRFDNYNQTEAREDEMRQILPRLGQIGASLAAVAPGGDVRDRLVSFLNDYDRSVGEESDETVVAQALRRIKSEQISEKTTATVGQIAIVACEISKSLGKGELSAKAVGSILRGTFGLKPRRSKGGWNVEIPDLADERLAVAGERGERCSGVSR